MSDDQFWQQVQNEERERWEEETLAGWLARSKETHEAMMAAVRKSRQFWDKWSRQWP